MCLSTVFPHPACSSARVTPRLLLVGGRRTRQAGRYGYMVRLHFLLDDKLGLLAGCGATLISRRVALTAAHVSGVGWGGVR